MKPIALYFDRAGYTESTQRSNSPQPGQPVGLMGRQVAGREFLDAYLQHGSWSELCALTNGAAARRALSDFCVQHASSRKRQRRLQTFEASRFQTEFLPAAPASVLHFPNPPDPSFAWARQQMPHRLAFSGVTHTLSSLRAVEVLRGLVTDPWEEYDRLICTSAAVRTMVQTVTDQYADYLQDRFGGTPRPRIQLETIPLGVNTDRYCPATPPQRTAVRDRLHIADDEFVVLFVGRLSHHAKAHPFPLFQACQQAARNTQRPLRLLLCGWSTSPAVTQAFQQAATAIAPDVKVDVVDGMDSDTRFDVWKAADTFVSLVDNIQETFGLVIVEAMASGLPVIASDWNGYRDLVTDGSTGFLIPTAAVRNAMPQLTSELLTGAINYDHFLARASQTVRVDSQAAADALTRLCNDDDLRRRMSTAARARAESVFDWRHVIAQYEQLWQDQQTQLLETNLANCDGPRSSSVAAKVNAAPTAYPPLEVTFAGYPTEWLTDESCVVAAADASVRLEHYLALPLLTHEAETRCSDPATLRALLQSVQQPCPLKDLLERCEDQIESSQRRSTLAWLLKYDLLLPVDEADE